MPGESPRALQSVIGPPIANAMAAARDGKIAEARQSLGLAPGNLGETEFQRQLEALDRANRMFSAGGLYEAAADFQKCSQVIDGITLPGLGTYFVILRDLSLGFSANQSGDIVEALRLFKRVRQSSEQLAFIFPEIQLWIDQAAIGENLALCSNRLHAGLIGEAEVFAGNVRELQAEMVRAFFRDGQTPGAVVIENSVTAIELATRFADAYLAQLDFRSAKNWLDDSTADAAKAEEVLKTIGRNLVSNMAAAYLALFGAMRALIPIAEAAIARREAVSKDMLKQLSNVYNVLVEAQREANRAGTRGNDIRRQISNLKIYVDNLTSMVEPRYGRVAGYGAGLVFGISLVAIMGVEYILMKPNALDWPVLMLPNLIASLIVGFGPGAVQFVPMLKLYKDVVAKSKAGDA